MMELGRPVGRADDERHPALMGLHDGRMELRRRGTAGDADDGGGAGGHGEPEGEEAGAALVEADVHPQPGASARASGVDREPGQITASVTPADPLVDQGGGKGGLYAHRACHSMSNNAVRGFRPPLVLLHGFTQTAACGVPSATCWPRTTPWSPSTCPDTPARTRCGPTCRRRPTWCARPSYHHRHRAV